MSPVMDETDGISPVPPGFVSLKSFNLQRVQESSLTSTPASDPRKAMIDDESSATGVVKLRKSLRHRPWVNYCQFDNSSDEESDSELSDQDAPSIRCLPKGVVRGCTECGNCQKVIARWHPEGSCRPILDDAPVFYPSEEEFKDTLKYIASICPKAESYGICRIVPPPSWQPPCPLKEKHLWEGSTFTTRIQRVDKLQNRESVKFLRNHSMMKRKRRRLAKMKAAFRENNVDISGINETGSYSQRFGFAQGPDFTLDSFQKYADHFKEQYFCNSLNANLRVEQFEPSIEDIEGEYWRIVEHPTEEIEVLYGADLETCMFGSGFPKATSGLLGSDSVDWYAKSSWNLNNVPRLPGSVLAFESGEISGVLVPWLYVGMCFSSFCWHVEDHHLYSLNYLHWGAPKIWYGVPGREALNLEAAMKNHLSDLFEEQPNLLHNLVTQFSPSILKLESVPVYRCIQHPGEFVVTFPRAYHSGFNCGFNCAEAVNIAPVDWLPHGQNAVELYCEQMRKITLSHDKLLLGAAREVVRVLWNVLFLKMDTPENRAWKDVSGPAGILAKSLKARVELERTRREHLSSSQISRMDSAFDTESERECVLCHYDLHLSAAGCPCSPDKFSCLIHAKHLCSCDWKTRFFLFRYEISELNTLCDAVGGKLSAVHKWGLQDLKLSLSSYINKDKLCQSRFSDPDCSDAKGNDKASMSLDFSPSSKNTSSSQDGKASVLQHSSTATKAGTKVLVIDSTTAITNTTSCQHRKSIVPSVAKEPGLQDNSSLKVKYDQNLQTTEVCISSYDKSSEECMVNTKPMRSSTNLTNYTSCSPLEQDVKQECHINSSVYCVGKNIPASKDDPLLCNVGNKREHIMPLKSGMERPNREGDSRSLMNFDGKETIYSFPNKHVSVLPKICPTVVDKQRDIKQDGVKSIAHGLLPSALESNEQGKGDSSGNCSSNSPSHLPVVSIAQRASHHKRCVNESITRHALDLLEKEVGERGTKSARTDQKQQCSVSLTGSSNSEEVNKAGKVNEFDNFNCWRDNGELAETCSSFPLNTVHKQNYTQKGPRMAKVVRRINYNVELLEYGVVLSGNLWSTSQAIFPKGYRSRVRYWSILDPTQMCYYISEILDSELFGPLFMIKLEQSPSEIFFHVSATNCWNMVRERVNNEIRRLHSLGRVNLPSFQPPGSVDGLEMFGLTSPTIIQVIEAMDTNRVCTEYWKSRPKLPNPSDRLDQRAIPPNMENKAPILKSLLKKASSEELHALHMSLSGDHPFTKHELLELVKEENRSRLGFDL
uniref:Putative lysine-specific demethylase JMJ16 isoform X1 n=1 Tax=Cymbidium ensifolium TaxID=78740 RepID=A0A5B9MTD3_CYMEN|nr:putative lysine-specific demethylase JMJ16 isoform X1 [Cymbidium ensifolium]QEG03035.1 putative lysine-specific demethylase JMJ16 isoform X2 [Cymbidium ensifolium]QEG03037.1 putative lysine-specific demethylase JMJ16 isoform X3 [Cymbidium ensifolium]QEG03038.1 putative lysine-specific demethylase JMJ16 isoform X4 [Cymbidium ensifolium]